MHSLALLMLMSGTPDWSRPYFEKGHGDAFIHFVVYGKLTPAAPLSRSKYRAQGVPEGIEMVKVQASQVAELTGGFGKMARDPKLLAAAKAAPEALVLQGTVKDPATLDYLRDVVGVVQWALDNGGIAVLDPQAFNWHSPAEWRERYFASGEPEVMNHVSIIISDDWYHTRGLRKFGRPDLSVHRVTKAMHKDVLETFNRFIGLQARGGWIPEGKEVKVGQLEGLFAKHGGAVEDPDFNNVHVELAPAKK